jgi:hypothetical protein
MSDWLNRLHGEGEARWKSEGRIAESRKKSEGRDPNENLRYEPINVGGTSYTNPSSSSGRRSQTAATAKPEPKRIKLNQG